MGKVFSALLVLCVAAVAWSTPGRLNKDGCHNSKKAGYHCHGTSSSGSSQRKATTTGISAPRTTQKPMKVYGGEIDTSDSTSKVEAGD